MKETVEDHRGSGKKNVRAIFMANAFPTPTVTSTLNCSPSASSLPRSKNYPEIQTFDGHFERCRTYFCKRINDGGKFNLWTGCPELKERIINFHEDY